jgi:hypothetical protein
VTGNVSRCSVCGQLFDSKRKLKEHKDKDHRITDSKIIRLPKESAKN